MASRMRTIVGRMSRGLRHAGGHSDLSPSQSEVLGTVARRGDVRLSELAAIEGINPTLLSRIIGKLETAGLLVREALHPGLHFFDIDSYEVATRSTVPQGAASTATVTLRAQDGVHSATAAGQGPFNALHLCLRKCLSKLYPQITDVRLTDYKVRVLDSNRGTAANVRVLIEWSDHRKSWSTVGVSDNVIEASWKALVDAIRLELMRLTESDSSVERAVEDYCWGV